MTSYDTPVDPRLVAALRVQLARRRAVLEQGARPLGWKIAGDIPEIDEVTGGEPAIGYLTSASQLEPGGTYSAADTAALHADTEVVIEVGDDGAIAGLRVGLELVDLARPGGMEAIVAANVLHRAFAVGPLVTATSTAEHVATVEHVSRLLDAVGEVLGPGDWIFAGSLTQIPLSPGDVATAELDGLGRVQITITS
jgi:2-keto-4-pentenoate hydratase